MKKIIEYKIASGYSFPDLIITVEKYIELGFIPLGGISHSGTMAQAMVKYEKDNNDDSSSNTDL